MLLHACATSNPSVFMTVHGVGHVYKLSGAAVQGVLLCWAGSLVLGQNQECYGACFSPSEALTGDIAALRIWGRALTQVRPALTTTWGFYLDQR